MTLYFLALNPEVQERLYQEMCDELYGMNVNTHDFFDRVMKNDYLDACVKETLRRNPPLGRLQRRCNTQSYKLAGISLDKDMEVQIPTFVIHHNPEYYANPFEYDPERFMPENKQNLVPYT